MIGKIYEGDVGIKIEMHLDTDLSNVSNVTFLVKKPSGLEVQWSANIEDVTKGVVYYITALGDLDEAGEYKIQALVEFMDGSKLYSETKKFYVHKLFE